MILIATLLVCGACAVTGGDQRVDAEQTIDAIMQAYQGDVPGASVLVVRDGNSLIRRSYGLANLEEGTRATPVTNYRLASVTKQFTAAAILLLIEDGRLALDDRLRQWLPSLPASNDAITIRHLLTHTSGLIDYEEVMPADQATQLRDSDVLRLQKGRIDCISCQAATTATATADIPCWPSSWKKSRANHSRNS